MREIFRAWTASEPREAPPRVEKALRLEFRRRKRKQKKLAPLWFAGAVAAALATGIWVLPRPVPAPEPRLAAIEIPRFPPPERVPVKTVRRRVRVSRPPQAVTSAFYTLPGGGPFESGAVVRMEMPRSVMGLVGLPFDEARGLQLIQADVVLAQDGLPRAIRFIQ